jgi:hypothetical protein
MVDELRDAGTSGDPPHGSQSAGTAPDAVEMPRATVAPFVLAFGMVLLAAGIILGPGFLIVGAVLFVAGLGTWITQLLPGHGHFHEEFVAEDQRAHREVGAAGSVERLREGLPGYRLRLPQDVHPISAGIKGGIVGGIVMLVPALLWGVLSGNGFWYPVNLLAGMVLPGVGNMDSAELGQFHLSLVVAAVVIHIVLSVVIGLIYGVLLPTLPSVPRPISWGAVLMPVLWTAANYVAMRIANPALPGEINWPWFIVSQFVFGITMSAVVLGAKRLPAVVAGILGGLIGGAAMAIPAVIWGAASSRGFWYPVNVLAEIVLRVPAPVDAAQLGQFHAEWFVAALAVHAVFSIAFGVLFALLAKRLPPMPETIPWGGVILPMVWTALSYGLMGVLNPTLEDGVSWPWFIVSQFVFGVAAALVVLRSETVHVPPAGPGPERAVRPARSQRVEP